jgi:hypothetical protein
METEKKVIKYLKDHPNVSTFPSDIAEEYNLDPLETFNLCEKMVKKGKIVYRSSLTEEIESKEKCYWESVDHNCRFKKEGEYLFKDKNLVCNNQIKQICRHYKKD